MTKSSSNSDRIFTKTFTTIALINLFVWMGWQSLLTGLPLVATAHGAGSVYAGLLTTVGATAALIVRPLTGIAVDSIGRKPVLITSLVVMMILCIGNIIFPIGTIGLVFHFLEGVAWGFASTANSTLPLDVINPKRFAESMAFFGIFSAVAMSIAPTVTSQLDDHNCNKLIIYSAMMFLAITLLLSFVLFKGDYKEPDIENRISLKESFRIDRIIFPKAIFPSVFVCLLTISTGSVQTFLNLLCEDRGLNDTYIYYVTYAVAAILVKPVIGRLTDRRGYYACGIFGCLVSAASMAFVAYTGSNIMLFISGAAVGIALGSAGTVFQSMAVSLADNSSRGAATSTYMLFLNLGAAIGGTLGGELVSSVGYTGMFLVMGGIQVLAVIIFVMGGRKRIASYSPNVIDRK